MLKKLNSVSLQTKLNLGCGSDVKEGYTNFDMSISDVVLQHTKGETSIIIGDILDIHEFPSNFFTEVYAQMVFEHIHLHVVPTVLYQLHCVMAPGAKLIIIVPDFTHIIESFRKSLLSLEECTYQLLDPNLNSKSGRGHQSLWTDTQATIWLEKEGFSNIVCKNFGPHNIFLEITAEKSESNLFSVGTV